MMPSLEKSENTLFIALLAILPIFLALLNEAWLYTMPGIDAWIYYGYFFNLPENLRHFPDAYFGDRLPWILPGYLLHQAFPPLTANLMLRFVLWYGAIFSLYTTIRHLFGGKTAFFVALIMGCYAPFLGAVGWNYTDGIVLVYMSLTLLGLVKASDSLEWPRWMFGAGFFFAAMWYVNFSTFIYAPLLGFFFIAARQHQQSIAKSLGYALGGFFGLTALLMVANIVINGNPWFYWNSISFAILRENDAGNFVARVGTGWRESYHVILTLAIFLASLIYLAKHYQRRDRNFAIIGYFVATVIAAAILENGAFQAISLQYYANYLLLPAFLTLAVLLHGQLNTLSDRNFAILSVISAAIMTLPLVSSQWRELAIQPIDIAFPIIPLIMLLSASLLFWIRFSRFPAAIPFLVLVSLIGYRGVALPTYPANAPSDLEYAHRDFALAVAESIEEINAIRAPERVNYLWFSNQADTPYYAIASAYVNPNSFLGQPFPQIYQPERLQAGDQITIISELDREVFEEDAARELSKINFEPIWRGYSEINYQAWDFSIAVLELDSCDDPLPEDYAMLDAAISDVTIFYPASDLATLTSDFSRQHDCLLSDSEIETHRDLVGTVTLIQDESMLLLSEENERELEAWRMGKQASNLRAAGIEYIFVTGNWMGWLPSEEYQRFVNQEGYELVRSWIFAEVDNQYFLYRVTN